jgi:hypothetical protein
MQIANAFGQLGIPLSKAKTEDGDAIREQAARD